MFRYKERFIIKRVHNSNQCVPLGTYCILGKQENRSTKKQVKQNALPLPVKQCKERMHKNARSKHERRPHRLRPQKLLQRRPKLLLLLSLHNHTRHHQRPNNRTRKNITPQITRNTTRNMDNQQELQFKNGQKP